MIHAGIVAVRLRSVALDDQPLGCQLVLNRLQMAAHAVGSALGASRGPSHDGPARLRWCYVSELGRARHDAYGGQPLLTLPGQMRWSRQLTPIAQSMLRRVSKRVFI